jgi:transposase
VFAQSPKALREVLTDVVEDAGNELGWLARLALQRAHLHWLEIETHLAWCDERIAVHVKADAQATQAARLTGVGPATASAVVASVGEFGQFRTARQFGAWLGLVPKQNSSGGKASLGHITKRGDQTCAPCSSRARSRP